MNKLLNILGTISVMFYTLISYLYSFTLKFVLNILFYTCSWKTLSNSILFDVSENKTPLLICCWHNRGILLAGYCKLNKLPVWGISSTHADSEILARVLRSWNINLIRGSSTRGWFNVIKKLVALFKVSTSIVVVTPDGPRGPLKKAKSGAFKVAKKNGAQIIACSAFVSRCWQLPSWDRTIIPKPFSTIYIKFSAPFPPDRSPESATISSFINKNQQQLDDYVNKNN